MGIRYEVYTETEKDVLKNIQLFDLFSINWSSFVFKSFINYTITSVEAQKPWLIGVNHYNSESYTEPLLLINNVMNILDLKIGTILKVPPLDELRGFMFRFV